MKDQLQNERSLKEALKNALWLLYECAGSGTRLKELAAELKSSPILQMASGVIRMTTVGVLTVSNGLFTMLLGWFISICLAFVRALVMLLTFGSMF